MVHGAAFYLLRVVLFVTTSLFYCADSTELNLEFGPNTPAHIQANAVNGVIQRTIGINAAKRFDVQINQDMRTNSFMLSKHEQSIQIKASNGPSATKAFHQYLKYHLNVDITWRDIEQLDDHILPTDFDKWPNVTLTIQSPDPIIYYQNVCTWSYSYAWWEWEPQWRRHIDWMAMMGITMALAPIQEELWYQVYTELGLTDNELDEFFAGPAFQAWQRMGNIRHWAGPLPAEYRRKQMQLQLEIVKSQRELGMTVAVPMFVGHIPRSILRLYPNATASTTAVPRWNNFADEDCCPLFLESSDPLFAEIGERFALKIQSIYGSTDHIYFGDPFNENEPRKANADYLATTAQHIYTTIRKHDSKAIWLLQGWMFIKNPFWSDDLIKAFLTSVPLGRLLILDLQSEQFPQYERTQSYHGQPFIWCMLHNFGGTLGMFGSAALVNRRIGEARNMTNSTIVGVGITPEGIHQNYVLYALALERAWTPDDLNLKQWFNDYADASYGPGGAENEDLRHAWALLQRSVYAYEGLRRMRGRYTINRRPALEMDIWTWYELEDVRQAWSLLLRAATGNKTHLQEQISYTHDLVDLTRQYLQAIADKIYLNTMAAFRRRELNRFDYNSKLLLEVFDDLEMILGTHSDFMLGPWLEAAKRCGETPAQRRLFELNARNQITAWGPQGQILDYATKQWAGIVSDYYRPRWTLFLGQLSDVLRNGSSAATFDAARYRRQVANEIENPFTIQTKIYPIEPNAGNGKLTFVVTQRLHCKWVTLVRMNATFAKYTRLRVPIRKS